MHPADQLSPIPTGPFARLGGWVARHRRAVMLIWLALFLVLAPFASQLAGKLTQGGFQIAGSTSDNARAIIATRFAHNYPASITVVLTSPTLSPSDPAFQKVIASTATTLANQGAVVGGVITPAQDPTLAFPKAHTALIQVGLTQGIDQVLNHIDTIITSAQAQSTSQVHVGVTGGPAIFRDFNSVNQKDLAVSESEQVPLILLVLVLFFGSLWAAGIPIIATIAALISTLGALWFLASVMSLSVYVQNVVPLIGIGVGVDYSLFIVSRFRDELHGGHTVVDAVTITVGRAGKAITFSGISVAVALAGMFAVGVPIFTGFAVGTIGVVILAVAVGITLTPAILAALGDRVFRLDAKAATRRLFRRPEKSYGSTNEGFWERWADTVMRHPWLVVISVTIVLLAIASPAITMRTGSSGYTALPADTPARSVSAQLVAAAGPGSEDPFSVVVDSPTVIAPGDPAIAQLMAQIAKDPAVAAVSPRIGYSTDHRAAVITVTPTQGEDSQVSQDLAGRIATIYGPEVGGGTKVYVGGAASGNRDFTNTVSQNLPIVITLVMGLTFLVLLVLFRSVLLPLKAVVMTLLSVLAAYGVLVAVFQWGWADSLFGFHHLGHVTNWVPPFLFSILFGLSMDYEVFLLARIRERRDQGATDREAVAYGLAHTARIISYAALLMIIVFGLFLSNRLVPLKELSLGLAIAIFLDATLVRLLLVPAFMRLAGKWNWWLPGFLDRIIPVIEE